MGACKEAGRSLLSLLELLLCVAVKNKRLRDELEAVLIAAMPTANSAKPKLLKERMPAQVIKLLYDIYLHNKA